MIFGTVVKVTLRKGDNHLLLKLLKRGDELKFTFGVRQDTGHLGGFAAYSALIGYVLVREPRLEPLALAFYHVDGAALAPPGAWRDDLVDVAKRHLFQVRRALDHSVGAGAQARRRRR